MRDDHSRKSVVKAVVAVVAAGLLGLVAKGFVLHADWSSNAHNVSESESSGWESLDRLSISPIASDASSDTEARTRAEQSSSGSRSSVLNSEPLPPRTAPLREVFEELDARARRGDRSAACRLALDLESCRLRPLFQASALMFEEGAAATAAGSESEASGVAAVQWASENLSHAEHICDGLSEEAIRTGWKYMLRAAELGDDTLAARFVALPPLDAENFLGNLDGWTAYRDRALPLLERSAWRGDPRAAYMLFRVLTGEADLRGVGVLGDSGRAIAYARYAARFADEATASYLSNSAQLLEGTVSQADRVRASEEYARLVSLGRTDRPIDFASGVFRDVDSTHCE